jgi:hypothetical protein
MTIFYCLRFETPPTWRARSPYLHVPVIPPSIEFPFRPSPPTTRRATVEVFEPAPARTAKKTSIPILRVLSLPGDNVSTELFPSNICSTVTWQSFSMPLRQHKPRLMLPSFGLLCQFGFQSFGKHCSCHLQSWCLRGDPDYRERASGRGKGMTAKFLLTSSRKMTRDIGDWGGGDGRFQPTQSHLHHLTARSA